MDTLRNIDINSEAVLLKEIKIPVLLKHLGIKDSYLDGVLKDIRNCMLLIIDEINNLFKEN